MCVCVCVCGSVYIYIYIYMCVCVCVCIYIYIYTHTHLPYVLNRSYTLLQPILALISSSVCVSHLTSTMSDCKKICILPQLELSLKKEIMK